MTITDERAMPVSVELLAILKSEADLGIVDVRRIAMPRLVIVVMTAGDGLSGVGWSAPWPWEQHRPKGAEIYARRNALGVLLKRRERMAERMWAAKDRA
jgi:hypothetical protein